MTTSITGQGIIAYKAPDDALSNESKNAVQNKVVNGEVTDLQNAIGQLEDKVLTNAVKDALLQIASKVAYIDGGGQTYYTDLFAALYSLDRITAVYTQTGTVTEFTDINDIKTDLVVTAYRADQTHYVLSDSDYTLSGTLLEGTSTITVTYRGLTDDFTVIVSPFILIQQDIHIGYSLQNEYISGTGGYYNTNSARSGYVDFDIPVKAGVTYLATVNWDNTYDLYCGIVTYGSNIYDLVSAHSNVSSITDTGWVHLSEANGVLEFTPTYDTALRINSKIGSGGTTAFNSANTYFNSIKIGRKTGA